MTRTTAVAKKGRTLALATAGDNRYSPRASSEPTQYEHGKFSVCEVVVRPKFPDQEMVLGVECTHEADGGDHYDARVEIHFDDTDEMTKRAPYGGERTGNACVIPAELIPTLIEYLQRIEAYRLTGRRATPDAPVRIGRTA